MNTVLVHSKHLVVRLRASEFVRHVATLASGTAAAQALTLLAAPLLARLYEPTHYAAVGLLTVIVGTAAIPASGHYDSAIVVAKRDSDGEALLVLAFWFTGISSLMILLVSLAWREAFIAYLEAETIRSWWRLIALMVFLTAIATTLNHYANRRRRYALISRVIVIQALVGVTLSLCLGAAGLQSQGLLISAFVVAVIGPAILTLSLRDELAGLSLRPSRLMLEVAKRYRQFPTYVSTTAFVDGIRSALPLILLTNAFTLEVVGYYTLGIRVFSAPLSFVSSSVSRVHHRKVAELAHVNPARLPTYTVRLCLALFVLAGIPSFVLYGFAPALFELVFGPNWRPAGQILAILLPSLTVKFVASTVSGVFAATGHLPLAAAWKVLALVTTFCVLNYWASRDDAFQFFYALVAVDVGLYLLLLSLILYAVRNVTLNHADAISKAS